MERTKNMEETEINKIIQCLYSEEESVSGERLNLAISFARTNYFSKSLDDIVEIIKSKSNVEIVNTILKDMDKESKEYQFLGLVNYLNYNFISINFGKSLIESKNEEEMNHVFDNLENRGMIVRKEINGIFGIEIHDNIKNLLIEIKSTKDVDYIINKIK